MSQDIAFGARSLSKVDVLAWSRERERELRLLHNLGALSLSFGTLANDDKSKSNSNSKS